MKPKPQPLISIETLGACEVKAVRKRPNSEGSPYSAFSALQY